MESRQRHIVEVAAQLLRDQGAAAVTVRAVAQAAGMQAPTIYRFFADKEALLDAVAEQVFADYVAEKAEVAGELDPVAELRAGWHTHIGFGLANGALYALLADPSRTTPSPAVEAGTAILHAKVHRLAAAGLLRVPERRAVELIHAAGTGALMTLLAAAPEDRDLTLADDLLEAVLRTILNDAAPVPRDDAAALAIAFRAVAPTLPALTPAERALLAEWLSR